MWELKRRKKYWIVHRNCDKIGKKSEGEVIKIVKG